MSVPSNLTALALDDYEALLTESPNWGFFNSAKIRTILLKYFADIENHEAVGHRRVDLPFRVETHSIRVRRTPYLIFYRPNEGLVVRIVHGKRDLLALLAEQLDDSGQIAPGQEKGGP